jgi:hypothetical protein
MAKSFQQTANVAPCGAIAACSGATVGNDASADCVEGGTPGTEVDSFGASSATTGNACVFFELDPDDGDSWDEGDYVARINVESANADITWTETHVCRVNSSCVSQETIGSLTGQSVSLGTTGPKSMTVPGAAVTPAAGDRIYIVCVFDMGGAHGNQTAALIPDQLIDTPLTAAAGSTQSLSGSAAATSSASGAARRTRGVSVAVAALALAAGALSATRPIAGSAAATSDATATLSVSGSTSIAGTAAATAGATGALSATRSISGTAAATGAPSGAVSVSGSTSLAGTVAATGTAAGAAVVTRGLGGGAVATSDATGSLSVSGSALLAGSAAATATAGGALSATRSIAGTATATGTASGAVSLSGSASLAGTTAAATSTSGAVSVARPLVGMLSASTASAGALSSTRSISGTVVATAAASGVITNPPKLLAGASATTTAATGAATVTRSLAGTAAATVAATGAVSVDAALAGTVAASSGASARIRTTNATIPITGSHVEIEPRGLRTALFARSLDVEVIVYRWKIGENLAPLRLALKNTDGSPLDLSAADAVELRVRQPNGAVVTWEAVITDDEAGEVEYAILATDLDAGGPGIWRFEAKVDWGGGRCDILPSHGVSRFWVGAVLE